MGRVAGGYRSSPLVSGHRMPEVSISRRALIRRSRHIRGSRTAHREAAAGRSHRPAPARTSARFRARPCRFPLPVPPSRLTRLGLPRAVPLRRSPRAVPAVTVPARRTPRRTCPPKWSGVTATPAAAVPARPLPATPVERRRYGVVPAGAGLGDSCVTSSEPQPAKQRKADQLPCLRCRLVIRKPHSPWRLNLARRGQNRAQSANRSRHLAPKCILRIELPMDLRKTSDTNQRQSARFAYMLRKAQPDHFSCRTGHRDPETQLLAFAKIGGFSMPLGRRRLKTHVASSERPGRVRVAAISGRRRASPQRPRVARVGATHKSRYSGPSHLKVLNLQME